MVYYGKPNVAIFNSFNFICIFLLGTGHYLSPGGGSEDFGGDHLIFRGTEGGISRN